MIVRPERPTDKTAVFRVNQEAFGQPDEAKLVDRLRHEADPVISLVAELDGQVVGHILFSPVALDPPSAEQLMGLAPMAVHPAFQKAGIGTALVNAGLQNCRNLGFAAVVVLGHPNYYPRFGFQPAATFGLACEYEVPAEVFMALELSPGSLTSTRGVVQYHPAFNQL